MKFLPYDRFDYLTDLERGEVLRRLGEAIEPKRWFRPFWSGVSRPFEGKLIGNGFECSRVITYRNSFLPFLRGVVEAHPLGGSRITGTMTLHPLVFAFVIFWCAIVGFAGFGFSIAWVGGQDLGAFVLIPFAMLLFMWVLTTFSFFFEARKARALLVELLDARPPLDGEAGFR